MVQPFVSAIAIMLLLSFGLALDSWGDNPVESVKLLQQAAQTATSVANIVDRDDVLRVISEAQPKAGDLRGVFATINMSEDPDDQDQALTFAASPQAKTGDLPAALATIKSIQNEADRASALHHRSTGRGGRFEGG